MEPSELENIGSLIRYPIRSRTKGSTVNSALNDSPNTLGKVRITRVKSQASYEHVSTPMPSKSKAFQSLKNVTVSLTKLELFPVDASVGESVVHEEGDNAELKKEEVLDKDKLQSTEVVQSGFKENKIDPDHLNDDAEPSISKVVDQSNITLNSKKTSDGTESVEETADLHTQHSITKSNLPDTVDSLKSEFNINLFESISVQDEPATEAITSETGNVDASNLFYTPMESLNEGTPQMILEKPSTANNDVNELPTVNAFEFDAYASSDAQLNHQSDSLSNNENNIPIQVRIKSPIISSIENKSNGTNIMDIETPKDSDDAIHHQSDGKPIDDGLGTTSFVAEVISSPQSTRPSIRQDNEIEQSVEDDERNRSLVFSDDEAQKAIHKDSMDVTEIEGSNISVQSLCSHVGEVKRSEMSFTVSETFNDFLAGTTNHSDIDRKTEHKFQSKRAYKIADTCDNDVSQELESLETKPRKILKAKRRSDVTTGSKEVKKRMSLHPNLKLSSGQMKKHYVSDDAQASKVENVEDSAKCQSKQHNIDNAREDDASKELENMYVERLRLHPSSLIKSTDSKDAYTVNDINANDDSEIMEVDQFLDIAETSNKDTSCDSKDEISEQLKDRQERERKAKKVGKQVKEAILTAAQLQYKKDEKSKEILEEDTSDAFQNSLATSKAIKRANGNTTEPEITASKLSKRDLKRKAVSSDEDNSSIVKTEIKKLKMLQSLETSAPKVENWRLKSSSRHQYPDKLNSKRNLMRAVGTKKVVSKTQWTTAGPFMVTKIPTNKNFDVSLMSTSQFTVTSLSDSNFIFNSYKDGSTTIHFQSSLRKG